MTDDTISSTKYCIKYIHVNSTILVTLLKKPLKLSRLIVLNATHLQLQQFLFPWQPTSFPAPSGLRGQYLIDFKFGKNQTRPSTQHNIFIYRYLLVKQIKHHQQISIQNTRSGQKSLFIMEVSNPVCCYGNKSC